MYQTVIDEQTFADVFERLQRVQQADGGVTLVTVGRHPELGCIVAIQDQFPGLVLRSEVPISVLTLAA